MTDLKNNEKQEILDRPWAIGSDDYETILKNVHGSSPEYILELGSGVSTAILASDFSNAELHSIESDKEHLALTRQRLSKKEVSNTKLIYSPLKVSYTNGVFYTYDTSVLPNNCMYDLIIIDGPIERIYPRGREAALYPLFSRLKVGGLVCLDDFHRKSAKYAVKNWIGYFGESLSVVNSTEGICVLRKNSEEPAGQRNPIAFFNSFVVFIGIIFTLSKYKARNIFISIFS